MENLSISEETNKCVHIHFTKQNMLGNHNDTDFCESRDDEEFKKHCVGF